MSPSGYGWGFGINTCEGLQFLEVNNDEKDDDKKRGCDEKKLRKRWSEVIRYGVKIKKREVYYDFCFNDSLLSIKLSRKYVRRFVYNTQFKKSRYE